MSRVRMFSHTIGKILYSVCFLFILYICTIPQISTLRLRMAEDGKPAWTFGIAARTYSWLPEIHYGGRRRICWNIACIRDVNDVNNWDAHWNDTRIHLHQITVEGWRTIKFPRWFTDMNRSRARSLLAIIAFYKQTFQAVIQARDAKIN